MNELALFSGGGGGLLGSVLLGHKIVGAVEIEPYCREIIMRRQRDGLLPVFPIWDDVRRFDGGPWRGKVDLITAGFPCQPFSVAGKRKGQDDERNMWPDAIRIIREVGPEFALLENVPGLLAESYFGTILGDLAESGYDARWTCLGADDVGANHKRKRLWILAYPKPSRLNDACERPKGYEGTARVKFGKLRESRLRSGRSADVADANNLRELQSTKVWNQERDGFINGGKNVSDSGRSNGQRSGPRSEQTGISESSNANWWVTEPALGRVAHGVARRVDRLKAIGNGQVPGVVQAVWELLND